MKFEKKEVVNYLKSYAKHLKTKPYKELLKQLKSDGYYNMMLGSNFGGMNMNLEDSVIAISTLAEENLQAAHFVSGLNLIVHQPINKFGSTLQKEKYLEFNNALKVGTLAVNEPDGAGFNQIKCSLRKVDDNFYLSGIKSLISNINDADYVLVFSNYYDSDKDCNNYTMLILDMDDPNISVGKKESKMGLDNIEVGDIYFKNVLIKPENILGGIGRGFEVLSYATNYMRLGIAAVSLGISKSAYSEALDYVKSRKINGIEMQKYQDVRFKLSSIYSQIKVMEMSIMYAISEFDENDNENSSILKRFVSENAKKI